MDTNKEAKIILVIEDHHTNSGVIAAALQTEPDEGHVVFEAANLIDARRIIKEHPPNIIFLSTDLKSESPIEFLQELNSDKEHRIPVVGVTTDDVSEQIRENYTNLVVDHIVVKPFDVKSLRKVVNKYGN